jgi:hypothetical protein
MFWAYKNKHLLLPPPSPDFQMFKHKKINYFILSLQAQQG